MARTTHFDLTPSEIRQYIRARDLPLHGHGEELRGPCPIHQGKDDNFALNSQTGDWYCHSQCGRGGSLIGLHIELTGQIFAEALKDLCRIVGRPAPNGVGKHLVATYNYTDEAGRFLFGIDRWEPKSFSAWQPDGTGGRINNIQGVQRVLYRLSKLKGADSVLIVEGEKDVHTLESLGFIATCNPLGAKKWRPEHSEFLAGKQVVLIPDQDETGRQHRKQVARSLHGVVRSLAIVEIPDGQGKDISDWVANGATRTTIEEAIAAATAAATIGAPKDRSDSEYKLRRFPSICITHRDLIELAEECLEALRNGPCEIYSHGFELVRIGRTNEKDRLGKRTVLQPMTPASLVVALGESARFEAVARDGELKISRPPRTTAVDILNYGSDRWRFPPLSAIVETPVFLQDGRILTATAYDPSSQLYYAGPLLPDLPDRPTREQAIVSAAYLAEHLFVDFPIRMRHPWRIYLDCF